MKRMTDFIISLLLIVMLSPVLLLVSFLVRIKMGTPVLFKQERPGLLGKPFYVYKFRTMNNKYDHHGNLLVDADRITAIGSMLRKLSIDELPQLFNVIKGDMSLVGPRPLLTEYLPLYTAEQNLRHKVRPGITGWAQVNGRNAITWEERFAFDIWYVNNQSLLLDMKIIFLTIIKVLKKDGITQKNHVSMKKFTGTDRDMV